MFLLPLDQILIEEINEGYGRLKANKKAWDEELKQREELEVNVDLSAASNPQIS